MNLPARQHALRPVLSGEIHARPAVALSAPMSISRLAMFGPVNPQELSDHLATLCRLNGAPVPDPGASYAFADLGAFKLRWERHTEFLGLTFFAPLVPEDDPFARPAVSLVPSGWLADLPGEAIAASHIAVLPDHQVEACLRRVGFASESLAGSSTAGGGARIWTDFRVHADGFGRILLGLGELPASQAGRVAQILWEIETYRMLALLALPPARAITPDLTEASARLDQMAVQAAAIEGLDAERAALQDLSALASRIERAAAATGDRFSAARAYNELVQRRLGELEEAPLPGLPTLSAFLSRRLAPALATVEATGARIGALSVRCARAVDLLRTRVALAQEAKSEDLLSALAETGRSQLRLQQTVEGLSVAAIAYYLLSILGYATKPWPWEAFGLSAEVLLAFAVPPVAAIVWLVVRRSRDKP
jgi:uncharacterized membrane-anchored protein